MTRRTGQAPAGSASVLFGMMAVFSLPELVLQLADLGVIGSARWRPLAYQNGAYWAGLLHGWRPNYAAQPWLMHVSHVFLHAGFLHLAGNMLAFWMIGRVVLARIGASRFVGWSAIVAIGGGIGFGLLARTPQPMVGTSGIVFGLAAIWFVMELQDRWALQDRRGAFRLAALVLPLIVAVNVAMQVLQAGGVAWQTHLGGFVTGGLLVLVAGMGRRNLA